MEKSDHINYWLTAAGYDLDSMMKNFISSNYDWSLFMGHLVLEKALKALWIKNNDGNIPTKTHNLLKLANEAKLKCEDIGLEFLTVVNTFNIEARYPDYKFSFRQKCTKEYTESALNQIKDFYKCITTQISQI